ncbi:MAG TPA: PRC-barrel domain-containing protein [Solirubrobacteraceae bacterium]|nr:PRC-barrel domain-containing protein [Solirubrobacteraceae bacterium]
MAAPVEEPDQLAGADVYNQVGEPLGSVRRLYGSGGDGPPSWVGVEVRTGMFGGRLVLVPLARLKQEDGQIRVPYDAQHLLDAPRIDAEEALTEEDLAALSDYFAVGRGDQPSEDNPSSYASQMPDAADPPEKLAPTD